MDIRNSQTKSGLILIDILVALALGTVFVAVIASASSSARDMFETARERSYALELYEAHKGEFEGMMPYESRSIDILPATATFIGMRFGTTTISATARWYGNERIQTDISIAVDSRHSDRSGPIVFNVVRTYPFDSLSEVIGAPLCSVDFSSRDIVGSYGFQHSVVRPLFASVIPISLPIDSLLPLTDLEVRNGIAYISADSAAAGDPDLIVADIEDVDGVSVVSSINTGPGIASIVLANDRVFAAAASTAAQLHVIRFDGLGSPSIEQKYSLPLPYATATPPMASSIFFKNGRVYLGTEKWVGEEFSIVDVVSSSSARKIGGLEIGSKVTDVYVDQKNAYITTAGYAQMMIVDITDSGNPVITHEFSPSGWERQEGKLVSAFEDSIIFGRTSGGFNVKNDHEIFAWASSTTTSQSASLDMPGGIYGAIADRPHIFVISRAIDKEIQVFDRSLSATSSVVFSLPVAPRSMTCDGDAFYILASTAPVIYKVTFK